MPCITAAQADTRNLGRWHAYNACASVRVHLSVSATRHVEASDRAGSRHEVLRLASSSIEVRRSGYLREGTTNTALYATRLGALLSAALVSRPCSRFGRSSAALYSVRRFHAQAPSGDVQSGASASLDRERPHWIPAQLPVMLGTDRTKPCSLSSRSVLARHAPLPNLRTARAVHRGRRVKDSGVGTYSQRGPQQRSRPASLFVRRARCSSGVARAVISRQRAMAA